MLDKLVSSWAPTLDCRNFSLLNVNCSSRLLTASLAGVGFVGDGLEGATSRLPGAREATSSALAPLLLLRSTRSLIFSLCFSLEPLVMCAAGRPLLRHTFSASWR